MALKIKYSRNAIKFLDKQTPKSAQQIKDAIDGLKKNPPEGDIRLLKGYSDNRKRLRKGGWRIIFKNSTDGKIEIIWIIDIGNRGDIYK